MTELQIRAFAAEAVDTETGIVEGIAVPWDQVIDLGWIREKFERGSITDAGAIKFFDQHRTVVGRAIASEDRPEGFFVRLKVSDTAAGRDLLALIRDKAVDSLSVGFIPLDERDEDGVTVRTRVDLLEVSAVTWPAYPGAVITDVRNAPTTPTEGKPTMGDTSTPTVTDAAERELRGLVTDLDRKVTVLESRSPEGDSPVVDRRSAGAILKALVAGDEATMEWYQRAQTHKFDELQQRATTGATSADAPVRAESVTSLIRLFDSSSGVQSRLFQRGTLPSTGNIVEYVELASNTIKVEEQVAESDTLAAGKLTFTPKTAPVKTYGGTAELTRQVVERSSVPVLNTTLEALTIEAGRRKKLVLRAAVAAAVAARKAIANDGGVVTLGATLAAGVAGNWEDALIDAAIRYDAEAAVPEALVVSAVVFKKLRSLTVAGERVFRVSEKNSTGYLNLPGLTGDMAGLPVYLDAGQTGTEAYFLNGRAIKQYDSALYSLADQNITNLTQQFGVYFYGAVALEVPQFIVPVKINAA